MVSLTSKDSPDEQHIETAPVKSRGRFAGHCRRRWWVWLIAFCLFVLVIMIIIVYAIFPAVAQKELDKTYLTLHSLSILDPTEDSFSLSINSTISGASGIAGHSHLDPMTISFYLQDSDESFMTLPLPGINGGGNIPVITTNVTTMIEDLTVFGGFAALLLGNEDLSFRIKGRTTIHVGKIHSKVNYRETVEMKGFNKLEGMQIQGYDLVSNNPEANLAGRVMIPNPTVVTIEMGDVHIAFSLGGTALGVGTIPNLIITPGNHEYDFRALLGGNALTALLGAMVAGPVSLTVRGNGTEIDGQDIPWLSAPLAALEVTVPIASEA